MPFSLDFWDLLCGMIQQCVCFLSGLPSSWGGLVNPGPFCRLSLFHTEERILGEEHRPSSRNGRRGSNARKDPIVKSAKQGAENHRQPVGSDGFKEMSGISLESFVMFVAPVASLAGVARAFGVVKAKPPGPRWEALNDLLAPTSPGSPILSSTNKRSPLIQRGLWALPPSPARRLISRRQRISRPPGQSPPLCGGVG